MKETKPSPSIISYYVATEEGIRLSKSHGRLEFERTKELIQRYAAKPPAVVIDVGAGTGIYSRWLAEQGYEVHLVEPASNLLEEAKLLSNQNPKSQIQSYSLSDARSMPFRDRFSDVILLCGPMYHITDRVERLKALKEAYRVTKKEGMIFAVGISRFASLMDAFSCEYITDPDFFTIVEDDLANGQHRNTTGKLEYFTEAYFHHPEELESEIKEAGFNHIDTLAVEGPARFFGNLTKFWDDEILKERILKLTRCIEKDSSILGASAHIMVVGKRS